MYKAYFSGLNFSEYHHKVWPYMVTLQTPRGVLGQRRLVPGRIGRKHDQISLRFHQPKTARFLC